MIEKSFVFKFKGKNAEEVAERFKAYFWDGGLDQIIEGEFLEEFGVSLDEVEFEDEGYTATILTDKI